MKSLKIVCITAFFCFSGQLFAQDWIGANRDSSGNVVYGSYLTNKWYDNWYIGAAGGISTAFSKVNKPRITPQFDFSILKWFTPSVGARIGFQGFSGKEYLTQEYSPRAISHTPLPYENGVLKYGLAYFHGDMFLNILNAFSGYKHNRFAELSIYANAGYCRLYDNTEGQGFTSKNCDNEFAFGIGLYNTLRITKRLVATIDLRHFSTASRYKVYEGTRTHRMSLTFGLSYNLNKTYWNRVQTIIKENASAKADAAASKAALGSAEKALVVIQEDIEESKVTTKKMEETIKQMDQSNQAIELSYQELKEKVEAAEMVLYFSLDSDKLNFSEEYHLKDYVSKILKENPSHVFYITGSADKGTGTLERNITLCQNRANNVRDILIRNYHVKPENIVIKATVVSDKNADGGLDRCVLIEGK